MARATELIRTTCPRDCYDACGILVVKTGGVIDRVKGDPDHPVARGTLCPKGEGRFEPVSWDEALEMIAGRLQPILAEFGGETIIQTHYTGTFSLIGYAFPLRFFHKIGATEVDPDTVCNKAGHAALEATFGSSLDGFDPQTARDAACILVWGANPSALHAHKHWLAEAPGKVIVIDPIRHPTAEAADLHLQPFPGTDAAPAFALLHVIRREGLRRALAREDLFTVAIDLFPTDTTDYADVVLPAANFLEFDDLMCSYFHYTVSVQVKAAEPMGASLPNPEIFRRLAAKMGFTELDLFESDEDMIAALLRQTGIGLTFAELAQRGTVPFQAAPLIPFLGGVFPTPSGKAEITSERFAAAGLPRVPRPDVQPRPTAGRLRVLSPASPWLMNSGYGNVAKVRVQAGPADVCLHPEEARRRGLGVGDPVPLKNEFGELRLQISLSDRVPPGVALVHKGRWPKLDPGGANVNVLNGGERADMAESSGVHSVEADLVPLAKTGRGLP